MKLKYNGMHGTKDQIYINVFGTNYFFKFDEETEVPDDIYEKLKDNPEFKWESNKIIEEIKKEKPTPKLVMLEKGGD